MLVNYSLNGITEINFCLNLNYIFLKNINRIYAVRLPYMFFFKNEKFLQLIFTKKYLFKNFLNLIINCGKSLFFLYFFKFRIKGLGYRIRKIAKNLFRFFFNSTNYFYFHVPKSCIAKSKIRKMILFSMDLSILNEVRANLLLLKTIIPYRVRGLIYLKQIIWLKPGKKKF
jgi:hypothetical protein